MAIVLASASPRRRELLEQMGLRFTVLPADCGEERPYTDPVQYVSDLAGAKAADVFARLEGDNVVIGADTIVVCQDEIMGKPKDRADARRMLQKLSGQVHQVYSGYAILKSEGGQARGAGGADVTQVALAQLSDREIEDYLDTGEYTDKAGGYAIQGFAGKFIVGITGSYATVVGLPIHKVYAALKELGEIQA